MCAAGVRRELAEAAIAGARAANGNAKTITDAEQEPAAAATAIAKGQPAQAVDRYKSAWSKAQSASRKP